MNNDTEFKEVRIAKVGAEGKDGWSIQLDDGWSFFVPATSPIAPKPGMVARLYGRGIGYTVRGLTLDGVTVFYRTDAEQREQGRRDIERREQEQRYDFEKNRAEMDRRYRDLPEVFQRRLDKFRQNNPDFRWKFERYEMFCCEQAVAIAEKVKADDLSAFANLEWRQQKMIVPKLDEGHSGNTFGCAVALARLYLSDSENVVKMHGALAPLVGSEEYGCVPRE